MTAARVDRLHAAGLLVRRPGLYAGLVMVLWLVGIYLFAVLAFALSSGVLLFLYLYVFFTFFVSGPSEDFFFYCFWPLVVLIFGWLGRYLTVRQAMVAAPATIFVTSVLAHILLAVLGVAIQIKE
jgi:hypothetical protein